MPNPGIFFSHEGGYLTFVDPALNSLSTCLVDGKALEKEAGKAIGRNLSQKKWKEFGLRGSYDSTFELPPFGDVSVAPVRPPQILSGPRAKRLHLVLEKSETLTNSDPLDRVRDRPSKFYMLKMMPGKKYVIDMMSTEFDSYLRLEGPDGVEIDQDDDSGGNLNVRIRFLCKNEGEHKVIATSFRGLGKYQVTVAEEALAPVFDKPRLENGNLAPLKGTLTPEDTEDTLRRNCPAKVYAVVLDADTLYQIDLQSQAFYPLLSP